MLIRLTPGWYNQFNITMMIAVLLQHKILRPKDGQPWPPPVIIKQRKLVMALTLVNMIAHTAMWPIKV